MCSSDLCMLPQVSAINGSVHTHGMWAVLPFDARPLSSWDFGDCKEGSGVQTIDNLAVFFPALTDCFAEYTFIRWWKYSSESQTFWLRVKIMSLSAVFVHQPLGNIPVSNEGRDIREFQSTQILLKRVISRSFYFTRLLSAILGIFSYTLFTPFCSVSDFLIFQFDCAKDYILTVR